MKPLNPSLFGWASKLQTQSQNNRLNIIHILFLIIPYQTFWNIFRCLERQKGVVVMIRNDGIIKDSEYQFGSHEPTLWLKNQLDHRVLQQMCRL